MTLPTVFQLLWGKPRVNVVLDEHYIDEQNGQTGKCLDCRIANPPIRSSVLRWIGVFRRPADGLSVTISIKEAKTATTLEVRTPKYTVSLPSSVQPELIFDIVQVDYSSKTTTIIPASRPGNFQLILAEGVYSVTISVSTTEARVRKYGKFSVRSTPEILCWEHN